MYNYSRVGRYIWYEVIKRSLSLDFKRPKTKGVKLDLKRKLSVPTGGSHDNKVYKHFENLIIHRDVPD